MINSAYRKILKKSYSMLIFSWRSTLIGLDLCLPLIHVTIDHGIVHRVGHGQPVDHQVDLLNVVTEVYLRIDVCCDKVCMIRQPADYEDHHHHHHHFYYLKLHRYFLNLLESAG